MHRAASVMTTESGREIDSSMRRDGAGGGVIKMALRDASDELIAVRWLAVGPRKLLK